MSTYRRWVILSLLFIASVINYLDRQSLSILASTIQKDLGMSNLGYAHVVQMFLLAYMLGFLVVGWLTDRLGSRASMILFIGWWSISNLLTGLVASVRGLAYTRFLLGAGESGLYVVAPKIVGQIFPASQRGLAVGIYSAGATIGATIAPPIIAASTLIYGWRAAFVAGGILGLLWLFPWFFASRTPAFGKQTLEKPRLISAGKVNWWRVFLRREVLLLLLIRAITDPVWQFVLYWLPKYLTDVQGMSLAQIGKMLWVVYLGADLGGIGAGYISGMLVRRGFVPTRAYKWVMTACALIVPSCAVIPMLHSHMNIIALAAFIALSTFAFMICVAALAVEVLPADQFGTSWGVVCVGSGLGGILFTNIVGHLVSYSYMPVFALMACLHPFSLLLVWFAGEGTSSGDLSASGG